MIKYAIGYVMIFVACIIMNVFMPLGWSMAVLVLLVIGDNFRRDMN